MVSFDDSIIKSSHCSKPSIHFIISSMVLSSISLSYPIDFSISSFWTSSQFRSPLFPVCWKTKPFSNYVWTFSKYLAVPFSSLVKTSTGCYFPHVLPANIQNLSDVRPFDPLVSLEVPVFKSSKYSIILSNSPFS